MVVARCLCFTRVGCRRSTAGTNVSSPHHASTAVTTMLLIIWEDTWRSVYHAMHNVTTVNFNSGNLDMNFLGSGRAVRCGLRSLRSGAALPQNPKLLGICDASKINDLSEQLKSWGVSVPFCEYCAFTSFIFFANKRHRTLWNKICGTVSVSGTSDSCLDRAPNSTANGSRNGRRGLPSGRKRSPLRPAGDCVQSPINRLPILLRFPGCECQQPSLFVSKSLGLHAVFFRRIPLAGLEFSRFRCVQYAA